MILISQIVDVNGLSLTKSSYLTTDHDRLLANRDTTKNKS